MKKIIISSLLLISSSILHSQVEILNEDFQQGIPVNWGNVNQDLLTPVDVNYQSSNGWISIVDPENSFDTVASSTSYFSPVGTANRWLVTPALSLGNYGNVISWNSKSQDASFPDNYLVLVSKTGTNLTDFTDTVGQIQGENFEWTTRTVYLNDTEYADQNIYIAFVNNTNNGFKLYLDSVIVNKEDPASITETESVKLSVFPNPANDHIQIQSPFDITSIKIRNSSGQLLIQEKNSKINISTLASGFYYLEILTNGYRVNKSFLKE